MTNWLNSEILNDCMTNYQTMQRRDANESKQQPSLRADGSSHSQRWLRNWAGSFLARARCKCRSNGAADSLNRIAQYI